MIKLFKRKMKAIHIFRLINNHATTFYKF